jgi:hypothetical protein
MEEFKQRRHLLVHGLLFILILGAEYDGSMSRNLYQVVLYYGYSFNE